MPLISASQCDKGRWATIVLMSSPETHIFEWSDAWLLQEGPPALITAGPDVVFELDGLSRDAVSAAVQWFEGSAIDSELPAEQAELRDLFVGLGALRPAPRPQSQFPVVGSAPVALVEALEARELSVVADTKLNDANLNDAHGRNIALVLKTSEHWPDAPNQPHLAVDLTHHHTLVLGPFVVPGATSCLRCLDRQTTRRWGIDQIPSRPAVSRWTAITAELVAIQLELAQRGESPLVNATIAWNLAEGTTEREHLLRAPSCGGQCRSPVSDNLVLPWLPA